MVPLKGSDLPDRTKSMQSKQRTVGQQTNQLDFMRMRESGVLYIRYYLSMSGSLSLLSDIRHCFCECSVSC